jgi:hypothetical protein
MNMLAIATMHVEKAGVFKKMSNKIPIKVEDTNLEVLARIAKAASRKFDCSMKIDFNNGNRQIEFIGDDSYKALIIEEVKEIFSKDEE